MAFRVPTFNLVCNIWTNMARPYPSVALPRIANVPCQLRELKTALIVTAEVGFRPAVILCVAASTDIRGQYDYVPPPPCLQDIIELPIGGNVWWAVNSVFDVAKGFANEYRSAVLERIQAAHPLA